MSAWSGRVLVGGAVARGEVEQQACLCVGLSGFLSWTATGAETPIACVGVEWVDPCRGRGIDHSSERPNGYELPSAFAYPMTALPTSSPIATPSTKSLRKWMPAHIRDAAFSLARLRK